METLSTTLYKTFHWRGTEALHAICRCPSFSSLPQIGDFYAELTEKSLLWCQSTLLPSLQENAEEGRARTPIPATYSLTFTQTFADASLLCIRADVMLRRYRLPTQAATDAHFWSVTEQQLIPPAQVMRQLFEKKAACEAFLLQDGKPYLLQRGVWVRWKDEKKNKSTKQHEKKLGKK